MKKIGLVLLLFCFQLFFSQNMRFVYEVTMKTDKDNKDDVKTEMAHLDVSPEKSIFYAENRIKRDSAIQRMRATRNFDRSVFENLRSSIDYIIEKNLQEKSTVFKQRIMRDEYQYPEDREMTWQILPETSTIGEYKVQKAETNFAGRHWIAWFSSDIPFQDGPYKFSGLPGLIIKVEDENGDYSFDLKESKKIAEIPTFQTRGNTIKVKRKNFVKQQNAFMKDPVSYMNSQFSSAPPPPPSNRSSGGRGRFQPDPQRIKEIQSRVKEELEKNDNPIELE